MANRPNLNVRNNNPLNIRFVESNNWDGQVGENSGFSVFESPEYGFRAAYKLLQTYRNNYGLSSLNEIVARWAPEDDGNHVAGYVDYLAEKLGKWSWAPIFEGEIPDLLLHMSNFEGAKGAYTIEDVNAGVALA